LLGVPFGDQGFCVTKKKYNLIGGFLETAPYGEDHLFVWHAKQRGIRIRSTNAALKTSARKYRQSGWFTTTLLYYQLWTKQASPEKLTLNKIKNGNTAAVAIFVKTPDLSPVKTRLAKTIGKNAALTFYDLGVRAITETLTLVQNKSRHTIHPYWAVAEEQGLTDERWLGFGRLAQPEGGLGERLAQIYTHLQKVHGHVMLIGADSPQITTELIENAQQILNKKNNFVIGPSRDGGFYLFGGSVPLAQEIWCAISFSQNTTCADLVKKIRPYGEVVFLPLLTDVDVFEDLKYLNQELQKIKTTPAQNAVRQHVCELLKKDCV